MVQSVLIISDQSPVGKNFAAETIRIGSGFVALGEFIDCRIVFMGDAVYLLNKNASPEAVRDVLFRQHSGVDTGRCGRSADAVNSV